MASAPSGTVTFLFTDLEGSTRLWDDHPDAMADALGRHDGLLRDAVERAGGVVVKSTGDGTLAAFADAPAAVRAAVDAQRALQAEPWAVGPLRARMAIHTGTATERDGDYFGPTLNRTARIMSLAHGRQVLVSSTTRGLVDDADFVDLGEHGLRDLSRPQHVFQLVAEGLPRAFPELRSLENALTNLPAQLTSFVGRADETKALADLVRTHRLVTVTGVGGVGKTRLTLQVGADLLTQFADGVWLCELAAAQDEESLYQVVMSTLGVMPSGAPLTAVSEFLRSKTALVIIDNCEHLLDASAALCERILASCLHVSIITTSREALASPGERVFALRSLPVGTAGEASDAMQLFAERARAVRPDFVMDERTAPHVIDICTRLDGIPLAIELAAARVLALQPADIAAMLDERFRLLGGGRRASLERHQTLRAAVDWSYSLLTDAERLVFDRLSVFSGSFDVDAATTVAGAGLEPWDVVDALMTLVAKSMLSVETTTADTRYQLLETLRQYGLEQLQRRNEVDQFRRAHATHYAALAAEHGPRLVGPHETPARQRLLADIDNLRAAVFWALDAPDDDDARIGLRIIAAIAIFCTSARRTGVGDWAIRAAERAHLADAATRVPVLGAAVFGYMNAGRSPERALELAESALIDGLPADCPARVLAPGGRAVAVSTLGRWDESVQILEDSCRDLAAMGDIYGEVTLAAIVVIFLNLGGQVDEARARSAAVVSAARELGNPTALVTALFADGLAQLEHDPQHAAARFEESLALTAEGASDIVYGEIMEQLARLRSRYGDPAGALQAMREAIAYADSVGNLATTMTMLWYGTEVLVDLESFELAATVVGIGESSSVATLTRAIANADAERYRATVDVIRHALGSDRFEVLTGRGRIMTYHEAVPFVLREFGALLAGLTAPSPLPGRER